LNQQLVVENVKNLIKIFPIEKIQIFNEDITLIVKPSVVVDILILLKLHTCFQLKILQCISGVDFPSYKYRFKIVYELLSVRYNIRLRVKTFTHELLSVDSCDRVFLSASWYECEIWDMFGVFFRNHSNLKRILTDYGFEGYPLRKDFPLSGFIESRYNSSKKKVVNDPVQMCQEYRSFDFLSSWEVLKI